MLWEIRFLMFLGSCSVLRLRPDSEAQGLMRPQEGWDRHGRRRRRVALRRAMAGRRSYEEIVASRSYGDWGSSKDWIELFIRNEKILSSDSEFWRIFRNFCNFFCNVRSIWTFLLEWIWYEKTGYENSKHEKWKYKREKIRENFEENTGKIQGIFLKFD